MSFFLGILLTCQLTTPTCQRLDDQNYIQVLGAFERNYLFRSIIVGGYYQGL